MRTAKHRKERPSISSHCRCDRSWPTTTRPFPNISGILAGSGGRPQSGLSATEVADKADKAMAILRRAVAVGYHNPGAFRNESALDALRNRPDFQLLMMDLAFPSEPYARGD
jgi:hypothetical protein